MAITYIKLRETQEAWGIDVLTKFYDDTNNQDTVILFGFKDALDITNNYTSRMTATIPKIEADKIRDKYDGETIADIDTWFVTNNTLRKNEYEDIKKEKKVK